MAGPIESIVSAGTKLWLDSVDPDLLDHWKARGHTGATSNPIIVADLVNSGRFDDELHKAFDAGKDDDEAAWAMTDLLVKNAQDKLVDQWQASKGDDGYVSFELDPLLEDEELATPHDKRVEQYIELGLKWSKGHQNRMIKVPATAAGIASLTKLAAEGITLNVTLIFTPRQYRAARDAIWRGAQQRESLDSFKSVYSIFISRVDVYTQKHLPSLSDKAQGMVGLANAKQLWQENDAFWEAKPTRLSQEIIFASTGTKLDSDPKDKYIAALVGDGIQTNPPATMDAVVKMGKSYSRTIDKMPSQEVLDEISEKVDMSAVEKTLVAEGAKKFADPHKDLIKAIAEKRAAMAAG